MQRKQINARANWQQRVEELGFSFHSIGDRYWNEFACYEFTSQQIEQLEKATNTLFDMCIEAVQHVIDNKLYHLFKIPVEFVPLIEKSWDEDVPSIYGRFDFAYNGHDAPKMLEFNADTPTSLFEASVVQYYWLQDFNKSYDQFNSIHEKLIAYWAYLKDYLHKDSLFFTTVSDFEEDYITTQYLRDCAIQAGLDTEFISIDEIGWDEESQCFVDMEMQPIKNIFKLYPWEWLINEEFGKNILLDTSNTFWIEPIWKMLLSNKAILPILWKLYPDHELLLPAFFDHEDVGFDYVRKPLLSREGGNIEIVKNGQTVAQTDGSYGEEGFIKQKLVDVPSFDGHYPIIGSWIIGCEAAGIGIRESVGLITENESTFVPHYFK